MFETLILGATFDVREILNPDENSLSNCLSISINPHVAVTSHKKR